jgi:integrase
MKSASSRPRPFDTQNRVKPIENCELNCELPKYVVVRGGDWYVRRLFPTADLTPKGKIKYISIEKKCEPQTAERAALLAEKIEAAYVRETEAVGNPLTLNEFALQFFDAKETHVRRKTLDNYKWLFNHHVERDALGRKPFDQVKTIDLQSLYKRLADRGVSPSTIRKVHIVLAMMFRQAVKWEAIEKAPTAGVIVPRVKRKEVLAMNWDEARAFLAAARDADAVVFEFALETGMRPGEYLALTWADIDFDRKTVRITKAVSSGLAGGGIERGEPKTRAGRRTVEISPELCERLIHHMELQAVWVKGLMSSGRSDVLKTLKANGLVFPSQVGKHREYHNLERRDLQGVLAAAGLDGKGFNLYTLRHTMATLALDGGADIKAISEKLGHASVQITYDTYAHLTSRLRSDATTALTGRLYAKKEPVDRDELNARRKVGNRRKT